MAVDYQVYTDLFQVTKDGAFLREFPEPDALALAALDRGQRVQRLDTVNWNGAWLRFYVDVAGGKKYEGYLHFEDVEDIDDAAPAAQPPAAQPAPPQQQPQSPAQPAPAPQQQAPSQTQPGPAPQPSGPAPAAGAPMIALGCVDAGVSDAACTAYMQAVQRMTGLRAPTGRRRAPT